MKLPFTIRQSTLEVSKCLFRLHEEFLNGHRSPESDFATRGSDFHKLASQYVSFLMASEQETDWSYADQLIGQSHWNDEAVELFKSWVQRSVFDPSIIIGCEFKIRLNADFEPCSDEDAMYSGDLDRLEVSGTAATIIDLKTQFRAFSPTTIQSIYYPWLLFKIIPYIESVTFVLDFVRFDIQRSREFTREHLQQMDRYVSAQVARLREAFESDEWPASVSAQCPYCHLPCPLIAAGMSRESIGQIQSPEQAQAMASQLFALRRASTQLLTTLKAYASENGEIDAGNDIKLGFRLQKQLEYDVRRIQSFNDQYGFPATKALKVSARDFEKAYKNYPEAITAAQVTAKDKSKTKFQFFSETGDPLDMDEEEFD